MLLIFGRLFLLLCDMLLVTTEQNKSGIFRINPDRLDTKLDIYRISTFENISPRMCFDKCLRRPRCHSYNYNRHLLRCELNYQPIYESSSDFLNVVGFMYVEVGHYRGDPLYDTCLGNPCKPGEICEGTNDGDVFCVKEHEEIGETDCTNLKKLNPQNESGVYTIYSPKIEEGIQVFCDMTNGGWTVIQRRTDGSENFRRTWVEYENGFGDLQKEFWIGNKCLNLLTSSGSYKLRVELVDIYNNSNFAEYSKFVIGDAASRYTLTVNGYSGTSGLGNHMYYNNGRHFTTYDHDNDGSSGNCANTEGAWWHGSCSYVYLNSDLGNKLRWWSRNYIKSNMMIQRIT